MASKCQMSVANLQEFAAVFQIFIQLFCSKPSQIELTTGIWLPVANSTKNKFANWHLAAICQLTIQLLGSKPLSNLINIWRPVANSPGLANWHPESEVSCHLPVADWSGKWQLAANLTEITHTGLFLLRGIPIPNSNFFPLRAAPRFQTVWGQLPVCKDSLLQDVDKHSSVSFRLNP